MAYGDTARLRDISKINDRSFMKNWLSESSWANWAIVSEIIEQHTIMGYVLIRSKYK